MKTKASMYILVLRYSKNMLHHTSLQKNTLYVWNRWNASSLIIATFSNRYMHLVYFISNLAKNSTNIKELQISMYVPVWKYIIRALLIYLGKNLPPDYWMNFTLFFKWNTHQKPGLKQYKSRTEEARVRYPKDIFDYF